jgi:hypothetical protein
MNWNQIVNKIKPHVVKIKTPTGSGTGFLFMYSGDGSWCGIATADHVVNDVDEWKQPLKFIHQSSKKTEHYIEEKDRVIICDPINDSAVILFHKPAELELPTDIIRLRPLEEKLDIGSEVGWVGYPYLGESTLCFFSGNISARNDERKHYLVDGVAINGVSGGPVLYSSETNGVEIIGIMCAYMANTATGSTLPGLSVAQDVFHLHKSVAMIKDIDEARRKKEDLKKESKNDGVEQKQEEKSTPSAM